MEVTDGEWSAEQWTSALCDRYFSPTFSDEPVTFCTDGDELASIRGCPAPEAIEDLATVVRREVMPSYRFNVVKRRADRWKQNGCVGPPPSLPLLALAVLAATQPGAYQRGAANYYQPFRRLLDPTDDEPGAPGDYAETIPDMWEQLKWWLNDHLGGQRGLATITKHEHFTNIGYARQQAILTASDRRRLYRFLRGIGFEPGDDVIAEELRSALAIWAKRLGPTGERLVRLATDPAIELYADELLRRIAERWDGRIRDPRTGSAALSLRLILEDRPVRLGVLLERAESDPERVEFDFRGATIELLSAGTFFEPAPLPISAEEVLEVGLELSGSTVAAVFDPAPAFPFAYSDDVAEWVSSNRITFGEQHLLLVHRTVRAAVQAWLGAEGLNARLDTAATQSLPEGWFLFRRFRLDARPTNEPPTAIADLLGTSGGARTRLVGGLTVGGLRRTYLENGLPFLAFPTTTESVSFTLETDGHAPVALTTDRGEYPLHLINLGPGAYRIKHPRGIIDFDVTTGFSQKPGHDVGQIRATGVDGRTAAGMVTDMVPPSRPVAVKPGTDATCAVLGPGPSDVALVETPRWLTDVVGPLTWTTTDVWCEFAPTWLLRLTDDTYEAIPLGHTEPTGGRGNGSWDRLILRSRPVSDDPVVLALWDQYRLAAETSSL